MQLFVVFLLFSLEKFACTRLTQHDQDRLQKFGGIFFGNMGGGVVEAL